MSQSKSPIPVFLALFVGVIALGYGIHAYQGFSKRQEDIEETNRLVEEFNECQEAADWLSGRRFRLLWRRIRPFEHFPFHAP